MGVEQPMPERGDCWTREPNAGAAEVLRVDGGFVYYVSGRGRRGALQRGAVPARIHGLSVRAVRRPEGTLFALLCGALR